MTMKTLADIEQIAGRRAYDWLARDLETPVLSGPQAQGDLFVLPITSEVSGSDVLRAGVDVIEPTADGGHAHTLVAPDGGVALEWVDGHAHIIALICVAQPAYLLHDEHGASGIAPGNYELRRQTETSLAEQRRVAD